MGQTERRDPGSFEELNERGRTWPAWAQYLALFLGILVLVGPPIVSEVFFDGPSFELMIGESAVGLLLLYFSSKPPLSARIINKVVDDLVEESGSRITAAQDDTKNKNAEGLNPPYEPVALETAVKLWERVRPKKGEEKGSRANLNRGDNED